MSLGENKVIQADGGRLEMLNPEIMAKDQAFIPSDSDVSV